VAKFFVSFFESVPESKGKSGLIPVFCKFFPGELTAARVANRAGCAARMSDVLSKMPGGKMSEISDSTGKTTCASVEQEENHEKGPRWRWARTQMGNPGL
jgi:hypothetical protein